MTYFLHLFKIRDVTLPVITGIPAGLDVFLFIVFFSVALSGYWIPTRCKLV